MRMVMGPVEFVVVAEVNCGAIAAGYGFIGNGLVVDMGEVYIIFANSIKPNRERM